MSKKKMLGILDILFFTGLLIHSAIFFFVNKNVEFLYAATTEIQNRLTWRKIAEFIFSICSIIYIMGHIVWGYFMMVKCSYISLKTIFSYFAMQIGLMLLCTVPFALFNSAYFGDYFFPIWGVGGTLLIVLLVIAICGLLRKNRKI